MMNGQVDLFTMFNVPAPAVKEEKKAKTTTKPIKTVENADTTDGEENGNTKSKAKAPAVKKITPGEIIVKVYGMELLRINLEEEKDEIATLEDIREKIANEYGYAEFSKERTTMSYSKETRIVVPTVGFMKKG